MSVGTVAKPAKYKNLHEEKTMFSLFWTALEPAQKTWRLGLLFTRKMERNEVAPHPT